MKSPKNTPIDLPPETLAFDEETRRLCLAARTTRRPPDGWIRHMRRALGMNGAALAARLGATQPQVSAFEQRERDGTLPLGRLEEIAQALGGTLVYAIVPTESAAALVETRAAALAEELYRSDLAAASRRKNRTAGELKRNKDEQILARQQALLQNPKWLWRQDLSAAEISAALGEGE